ncbi:MULTISPECIES: PE family protein [Mycobacterium]|uniref:PE family protein n=1 Tax=Mycobacterium TaxID=1763 RepID=UPI0009B81169|nr:MULTISPECIES: PE family protein [Mycobacterium avium complex (MAC)]ASX03456.1 PE family protein [Mycobacterium intracellulare subsp. chimaera]PBA61240.1 PE family protein [Mycobacterium intracellulare subsp. chimaera]PBJ66572.1 PE family protein [Mycobacterium avium subsp. hominissuis]QWY63722.1 PE family protein [Mycobacterium avium subsp. hominissuis]QWY64987.1 PE family protein [Mycobacterium avium subsp. hominissuis]
MSFLTTQPQMLVVAACDLTGIRPAMHTGNTSAAPPRVGMVTAAADEVSVLTASQFTAHASLYPAASAHPSVVHDLVVSAFGSSVGSYAATEAATATAAR